MKTKIIIILTVIIILMGFGFWLFWPRTKNNPPISESELTDNLIIPQEEINVYAKKGAKNLVGSQALFSDRDSYSLNFKAYTDSSFTTPIWFYADKIKYSTSLAISPIETFGADFYMSSDALNYTLLENWNFDFNGEYTLFMPGQNDEVLSLKFNTFTGGILNLWKTFSYTPAHFGEIFDTFIREDFLKNDEIQTSNKYDLSKFFTIWIKNEETSLYEKSDKKLVFQVNFEKVDSLDEIITKTYYDEVLKDFSEQQITLTLNKANATLNFNEIAGADFYVIQDKNNSNFVFNSDTNSFSLSEVESIFWVSPNATKKLYVYGLKEIYDEEQNYYSFRKTLNSNEIEIKFNYISNEFTGGTVYFNENNNTLSWAYNAIGLDLLNKTYEVYINDILIATTQNTYLSLENLDFEQDIENDVNTVQIKCFSSDFKFAESTNDFYFLDREGIVANGEFAIFNDRFIGKPTNLTYDENNVLTWTGVAWAQNYTIRINAVPVAVLPATSLSFDFSSYIDTFRLGDNTISVFAMLNSWTAGAANQDFIYQHYSSVQYRNGDVEIPSNLFFGHPYMSSQWTLTWNGLDPQVADYYEIKIDDYVLTSNTKLYGQNKFTINLSNQNLVLSGGNHTVCVRAVIGDVYSEWSQGIELPVLNSVSDVSYDDETKELTFLTPTTTNSLQFYWAVQITDENGNSFGRPISVSQGNPPLTYTGQSATIDLSGVNAGTYTITIYVHSWSPLQTQIFTCKNMIPITITIS